MRQQHKHSHEFFKAWLQRSQVRKCKWQNAEINMNSSHFQLDHKIQRLRREIADLADQDRVLFQQFFALEDSIEELKVQMQSDQDDSDEEDFSSLNSSTCSLASVHRVKINIAAKCTRDEQPEEEEVCEPWNQKGPSSLFVRQRVSYPPISRNRCRRSQTITAVAVTAEKTCDVQEPLGCSTGTKRPHYLSLRGAKASSSDCSAQSSACSLDSGISMIPRIPSSRKLDCREIFV